MNILSLEQLGDWNPQLLREIKGRLKPRNVLIAVAVCLLSQLLLLMSFSAQLPVDNGMVREIHSRYCTGIDRFYDGRICLQDSLGGFEINWQLWWLDVFIWLSIIGFFALFVVGTYQLINDLSREEHRGTLNFIRLSPQSTSSILSGKLLGVPILLYLVAGLALPLHLWAGQSAHVPLKLILGYDAVVVVGCLFFYSAALLYGLVSSGLGGFQAWLGSVAVLLFLTMMTAISMEGNSLTYAPTDWLFVFSPAVMLSYLVKATSIHGTGYLQITELENWKWFGVPIGLSAWSAISFSLLSYGLCTYGIWQSLKRCFHNSGSTLLSKRQSYLLTACFEAAVLGFSLQVPKWRNYSDGLFQNFNSLLVLNLLLCLGLIAALSPHRQVLQDWARYRGLGTGNNSKFKIQNSKFPVVRDLIWGEKSPSLVAMALNLLIISAMLVPWILVWPAGEQKIAALWAVLLSVNLLLIYAFVAQLMLFMKTSKRVVWAATTVVGLVVLPPIVLGLLSLYPDKVPDLWLFSAFPWAAVKEAATTSVLLAIMGQWLTVALVGLQLTRQLRQAGESASKALMSGRAALPS